ncbi:MAG: hypothetical protein HPY52_17110 [Firmicutes bacterium]|nr:hypothetical protein [Bacillota bacterium]NPV81953.1 hypothetical protein [Bacillota bacterium]
MPYRIGIDPGIRVQRQRVLQALAVGNHSRELPLPYEKGSSFSKRKELDGTEQLE